MIRMTGVFVVLLLSLTGVARGEAVPLQGVVLDIAGKPVAGAELFLYDSPKTRRPADYISGRTGADGRFLMKVPEGTYWGVARVRHGEAFGPLLAGDLHSGDPQELTVTATTAEQQFTVADIREVAKDREKQQSSRALLSGTVTSSDGRPVAGAAVYLWREPLTDRLPDLISAWTEQDGRYALSITPGSYLASSSRQFPPQAPKDGLVRLVVGDSQKTVALHLQLSKMEKDSAHGEDTPVSGSSSDDE